MHQTNSIVMQAPKERIFAAAADLEKWPEFLPHYRYIHYYERSPERNVVKMAARRGAIPISWVSEQIIDPAREEVIFRHLKAWTKGMEVVWRFEPQADGVRVSIVHDLRFRVPIIGFIAEPIIGHFFIDYVATRTLRCMKEHVEHA